MTDERSPAFTDAFLFGEMIKDRPGGDQSIIGTAYTRLSMDKRREFWRLTDEEREDIVLGWLAQHHGVEADAELAAGTTRSLDDVLIEIDPNDFIEDAELEQQMPQEGGDYPFKAVQEWSEERDRPVMDSGYVTVEEVPHRPVEEALAEMESHPVIKAAVEAVERSGAAIKRMQARREAGESPEEVMRHTKHAYGCFQAADEDEPIFTLRAKDAFAPVLVLQWAQLVAQSIVHGDRSKEELDHLLDKLEDARHCARAMVEWQRNNGHKIPD